MAIRVFCCCAAFAALFVSPCSAQFAYRSDFSVPPFRIDESIVGQNNWEHFGSMFAPDSASRIVAVPWNEKESALLLQTNERADGRIRIRDGALGSSEFEGSFSVTTPLAFNFDPGDRRNGVTVIAFANLYAGHSPIVFGMDYSADGGLFYRGKAETGNVLILPKGEVQMDSFYNFQLDIDPISRVFDIKVTGVKADGSPFNYSVSGVEAGENGGFHGIYVESIDDPRFGVYIGTGTVSGNTP